VEYPTVAKLVKDLVIPIYGLTVVLGLDSKALSKHLQKKYGISHSIPEGHAGQAAIFEYGDSGYLVHTLYVDREIYNVGYLTHECLHCAWHLLGEVGVELTCENHEALAYLAGWLAEQVHEFYMKGKDNVG
jgi:hypothetical protein